jgi:pimeloyl-ACP methyl ester carboxylesterase
MHDDFRSAELHGRRLRYVCDGEGAPAVIIDQGQGLSIERGFERPEPIGWTRVFREVRKFTRVLMHDRAGLGSSDPPSGPRTSQEMVEDLRVVLAAAKVRPPYVLVGHSIGGFNVRLFAGRYPDDVAGVVLVDASHPDQLARFASVAPPEAPGEPLSLKFLRNAPVAMTSPEAIDLRACAEQARGIRTIGLKPLVVVSQSAMAMAPPGMLVPVWEKMRPVWSELQRDLLGLSAMSAQVVARYAGHMIQADEPGLVVEAILATVRDVRSGTRYLH